MALVQVAATDPIGFVKENLPELSLESQVAAAKGLFYGKRVCVWRELPTVYCLNPPMVSTADTLDLHQPAGEYKNLVIIDEYQPIEA